MKKHTPKSLESQCAKLLTKAMKAKGSSVKELKDLLPKSIVKKLAKQEAKKALSDRLDRLEEKVMRLSESFYGNSRRRTRRISERYRLWSRQLSMEAWYLAREISTSRSDFEEDEPKEWVNCIDIYMSMVN